MRGGRLASLATSLRAARSRDPRLFAARAALGLALLGLIAYLAFGSHPWRHGIGEQLRKNVPIRPIDYARTYGYWTAAVNTLVVGALLATARRWVGSSAAPSPTARAPGRARLPFTALVVAAMATSAILAWPRLSLSLWDDEQTTLIEYVDGAWRHTTSGLRYERVGWRDTFWDARKPNNHVPFSILSRLSVAAWRATTQPELPFVSERPVRLPAYLAGIASVAATALFLRRLGFAAAGVTAAWLLALHPWHMRYASEARGYALLFLLLPLGWLALVRALERGTWCRWLAFGLTQAALLWTHASMLYAVAPTQLAALLGIWHRHPETPQLRDQVHRWVVVNVLTALVVAQLMVPNLVQIFAYLAEWRGDTRGFGDKLLQSVLAHLLAGLPWSSREPWLYPDVASVAHAQPLFFGSVVALTLALLALGAVRLLRSGGVRADLVAALLLPGPLLYVGSWLRDDRFYPWYVVFALPGLAALVALGLAWPLESLGSTRARRGAGAAAIAGYLALFGWITSAPRAALRSTPIVPERESVLTMRPTLDPFAPENARIVTGSVYRGPSYYDALGYRVRSAAALEWLIARATEREADLFISVGRGYLVARRIPEVTRLLRRGDLFEEVAVVRGLDHDGTRHIYRFRGGPRRSP